jgi:dual specificity phosphatase 12
MFDPIMQVEDDLTTTLIQQSLTSPNPAQIADIPGLYISESVTNQPCPLPTFHRLTSSSITIPSSPANLQEYGFTHVLSLMSTSARPKILSSLGIVHKIIEIDDDALGNLLAILGEACKFIDDALKPENNEKEPRVLVHCLQGISRSGAVVVAYLMKSLDLEHADAVKLARKYRPVITINSGFEEQLGLWEDMGCDIYEEGGERREKALYREWKGRRDDKFSVEGEEGEVLRNRERTKSMASVAARFGARRMDLRDGGES